MKCSNPALWAVYCLLTAFGVGLAVGLVLGLGVGVAV